MRGPEEVKNAEADSSSSREGGSEGNEGRDPCSSPPCKRLKQAVLNFESNTATSNGIPPPSSPSLPKLSNGVPTEVIVIDDENRAPNFGGLVTAAPSPPDKGQVKPQSSDVESSTTKDQKEDEKQLNISNFTVPIDKLNDSHESDNQEIPCSPTQTSPNDAKTSPKPTSAEKKKCKEEIQKMKEEKQKLKEEKERQRLEAKAQKEKERLEAKQKKEQERLEKQAEKEKKEKERLEKKQKEEKEKQEKKEKKEEERRKKEEEINAKLEEKRKKEEEKKQQEEELKRKKKQASLSFKNFFTKTTSAPPKVRKTNIFLKEVHLEVQINKLF
ncbi:chromatin assembly factor 1 subunit A-like [Actinia tenebrosa]|uniref:Chromatin assembly factor 1 subunit A-like n=1 Tax=Actinia tenebrosa TaxID=6105 RepID=A0A6P8IS49_ACTTE|nr:chromatin assembly factor 1 subunit A-like [Actinia tenebrosa]